MSWLSKHGVAYAPKTTVGVAAYSSPPPLTRTRAAAKAEEHNLHERDSDGYLTVHRKSPLEAQRWSSMASGTTALDLLSVPPGDYHHEGFTTSGPLTHDVQDLSLRTINAVMLSPDVAFLQRALSPRLLSVSSAPCSAFSFTRRNLADFLDRVRRRPDFYTVHRHNVHEGTTTAEVNEASGKATVWMSGTIAGSLAEEEAITEREWMSKFEW
ncbi:hypothetical protein LTR53_004490 [Teratosphaeriaceae sp. CCFEE 6253]|nr:hypothetical protein LTR53_004490 [Teratosphaeriaceae sp. CCFEE 6253]